MSAYTPGPWKVDDYADDPRIRSERYCIALVTGGLDGDEKPEPTRLANAHLIAAAPELLEAVRALLAASDHTLPSEWRRDRPVSIAKAAIAKAEGRL
jgi:hypothetical protein